MENSTATVTGVQWSASSMVGLFGFDEISDRQDCGFFEIFGSFVWFFIFLFGMAKVVQVSERYLSQHILCCQNHLNEIQAMNREWEQTLQLCEADKVRLDGEVVTLSEKHVQLEGMLADMRSCNAHLINENLMRYVQQKQTTQLPPVPSNIYITNRHFHITRQVFINEGHLSVRNAAGGGGDVTSEEGISNVWMQYLKMRKCYMGPIAAERSLVTTLTPPGGAIDKALPVVMTTEQLAKLQGII